MKNKKILFGIFIFVIIIILVIFIIIRDSRDFGSNKISTTTQNDINTIEEIKKELNVTADTSMYEIQEEYDGRKIIQIKSSVQYDTILAGIIKNGKPKEKEISEILKNKPNQSGVWISSQSRDSFLKFLKENNIVGIDIDQDGYLYEKEKINNKKLKTAINSDKLFIIDMCGKFYTRDDLTGEIVEYPFEDMEPDQILERCSVENSSILEITTNSRGFLTNKEILDDILLNLD